MYLSSSGRLLRDIYRLDGKNWYIMQKIQSHIESIFQVEKKRDQSKYGSVGKAISAKTTGFQGHSKISRWFACPNFHRPNGILYTYSR